MGSDIRAAVEEFLVEHVMIGLGNIRVALARVEVTGQANAGLRDIGLSRIGGQIDHLEARARALHALLGRSDRDETPDMPIGAIAAPRVLFQSRRAH